VVEKETDKRDAWGARSRWGPSGVVRNGDRTARLPMIPPIGRRTVNAWHKARVFSRTYSATPRGFCVVLARHKGDLVLAPLVNLSANWTLPV
jgi:hypothetical protein